MNPCKSASAAARSSYNSHSYSWVTIQNYGVIWANLDGNNNFFVVHAPHGNVCKVISYVKNYKKEGKMVKET